MSARVRVLGLDEAVADLTAALDQELQQGMLRVAQAVAEEAAGHHSYENRTGSLQAATQAGGTRGAASDGEIVVEVVADTPYGEYVEAKLPFLEPAFEAADDRISAELENALQRAAERGGWIG